MRAFVAGASGAIGTRLLPQLIERRHEVLATRRWPGGGVRLGPSRSTSTSTDTLFATAQSAGVTLLARQRNNYRFGDEFRCARESCRETETH